MGNEVRRLFGLAATTDEKLERLAEAYIDAREWRSEETAALRKIDRRLTALALRLLRVEAALPDQNGGSDALPT